MKNLILILGLTFGLIFFCGCDLTNQTIADKVFTAIYTYKNNSSKELRFTIFTEYPNASDQASEFIIPINGSHTLTLVFEGEFKKPLRLANNSSLDDSTIIMYGDLVHVEDSSGENTLYHIENYTLITSENYKKEYEYILDDDFFIE